MEFNILYFQLVRRTFWKSGSSAAMDGHHEIVESDDEALAFVGNSRDAYTQELEDSHNDANHHGMTDEEYAQMLQQQEFESLGEGNTNRRPRSNSQNRTGGTMVDLFGDQNEAAPATLRDEQDQAYYQSLQRDQERERQEQERQRQEQQERRRQEEEERERQRIAQERIKKRREKSQRLKQEPSDSDSDVAKILIKLPDSSRVTRKFNYSDTLSDVFDYLDVTKELDIENYVLVTTYPIKRYSYEENGNLTLTEAGLNHKQVALNLSEKL